MNKILTVAFALILIVGVACNVMSTDRDTGLPPLADRTYYGAPLSRAQAATLAEVTAMSMPSATSIAVLGTLSMKPFIEGNSMVVIRKDALADTEVGDVVVFYHPNFENPLIHQVFRRNSDGSLYTRPMNKAMLGWDQVRVDESNYVGTYVGQFRYRTNSP